MSASEQHVRVYLPVTWADLAATGTIRTHGTGHAVTAAVRDADPDGDVEGWEFAAFLDACASALELLRGTTPATTPARRVVLAVDVDTGAVQPVSGSTVDVPAVVDVAAVAAVHTDGEQAEPVVAAVLGGRPTDLLDDVALEWYHRDELDALLSREGTAEETG